MNERDASDTLEGWSTTRRQDETTTCIHTIRQRRITPQQSRRCFQEAEGTQQPQADRHHERQIMQDRKQHAPSLTEFLLLAVVRSSCYVCAAVLGEDVCLSVCLSSPPSFPGYHGGIPASNDRLPRPRFDHRENSSKYAGTILPEPFRRTPKLALFIVRRIPSSSCGKFFCQPFSTASSSRLPKDRQELLTSLETYLEAWRKIADAHRLKKTETHTD